MFQQSRAEQSRMSEADTNTCATDMQTGDMWAMDWTRSSIGVCSVVCRYSKSDLELCGWCVKCDGTFVSEAARRGGEGRSCQR